MNPSVIAPMARRLGDLVQQHGLVPDAQPATPAEVLQAQQHLNLPSAWVEVYRSFSPEGLDLPASGNDQALYGAAELPAAQEGYGSPGWSPHWLVVGGEGEYPLVIDTSAGDDGVHLAELQAAGMGRSATRTWTARRLSDSTAGFLQEVCAYLEPLPRLEGALWMLPAQSRDAWQALVLKAWQEHPDVGAYVPVWQAWLGMEAVEPSGG